MARTLKSPLRIMTGCMTTHTNEKIRVDIYPPAQTIYFSLERGKTPVCSLDITSYVMQALREQERLLKEKQPLVPIEPKIPKKETKSPYEEIHDMLEEERHLHLAQIMQRLNEKGWELNRKATGGILKDMYKRGEVTIDEKLHYSLKAA